MAEPAKTNTLPVMCFAPDLTDETIAAYRGLVAGLAPSPLRDVMAECLAAVDAWWALPVSTRPAARWQIAHRSDPAAERATVEFPVTPLEDGQVKALWDLVPWPYEIEAMKGVLERECPAAGAVRDAAYHLLWYAAELALDREPVTQSALPAGV